MKTRILLDLGDFERYVIGFHYGTHVEAPKRRATRAQIRAFVGAAIRRVTQDLVVEMPPRQRATARRLAEGRQLTTSIKPPREQNLTLF